ncbi:hypothetical protein DAEQUDRAFT_741766 [Daedalea quercina L-15889]|uniref:Uncharacterized protein n=1 Tax=Daedalea quercina L-15889 TaxID=1314783 RepID=A0A165KX90_9APHY|nr:hypothetical protein DAEQUDRAFT_741766 [Daedalea quercina L-15889]
MAHASATGTGGFKMAPSHSRISANNYVLIASSTVYLFDRSILLSQEIDFVWHYRVSVAPILAILLHGATIVNFGLLCYEDLVNLDCNRAFLGTIASQVALAVFDTAIAELPLAVITALRVYAINGRSWPMPVIVLLLSLIRTAYDLFGTGTKTTVSLPAPLGCAVESTSSLNNSAVADVIVLVITWRYTYHTLRLACRGNDKPTLSFLLWRDGTVYFGSLLIISILDVVIYTKECDDRFSTIILSRFFLNLRQASHIMTSATTLSSDLSPTLSSSMHFLRDVDVLGGSITFGGNDDDVHHDDNIDHDEPANGEVLKRLGERTRCGTRQVPSVADLVAFMDVRSFLFVALSMYSSNVIYVTCGLLPLVDPPPPYSTPRCPAYRMMSLPKFQEPRGTYEMNNGTNESYVIMQVGSDTAEKFFTTRDGVATALRAVVRHLSTLPSGRIDVQRVQQAPRQKNAYRASCHLEQVPASEPDERQELSTPNMNLVVIKYGLSCITTSNGAESY